MELKAIKIIKNDIDFLKGLNVDEQKILPFREALAELEQLEPKSCEGCKYHRTKLNGVCWFQCKRNTQDHYTHKAKG